MPLVTLRELLDTAATHGFAVPAFNVNNLEQVQAIMRAASELDAPVILQASAGARRYAGSSFLKKLLKAAIDTYPHLPICLHQDHGASPAVCLRSIQLGFSSVMMDGSLLADMKTPSSFEYNLNVTKEVVSMAHACGVSVEGELGCLGSLSTMKAEKEDDSGAQGLLSREQLLTSVSEAIEFVRYTNVDALAIAIGTSHGAYKFSTPPQEEVLAIGRLKQLHAALPQTHFVLHGASSVPTYLIDQINEYGGCLSKTYGVPVETLQDAIKLGVRKINIDTDLRLAATAAIRQYLAIHTKEFDPRYYLAEARMLMQKVCKERYEQFNAAGKASLVQGRSLEEMSVFYEEL